MKEKAKNLSAQKLLDQYDYYKAIYNEDSSPQIVLECMNVIREEIVERLWRLENLLK